MAAATLSREALEPLLGATNGEDERACRQVTLAATGALVMVKYCVSHTVQPCCSTDKAAASTCILAEGMQQADERAAKKARWLSVLLHATSVHEAAARLTSSGNATCVDATLRACRFNGNSQWRCCCVSHS